jgi:LPXTG-motif cell wall-anchored protein
MQKNIQTMMSFIQANINVSFLLYLLALPATLQAEANPPGGGGGGGQGGTGAEPETWILFLMMMIVLSAGLFFKQKRLSKNA